MCDYIKHSMIHLMGENTIFLCKEESNLKSLLDNLYEMGYVFNYGEDLNDTYNNLKLHILDYFIMTYTSIPGDKKIAVFNNSDLSYYQELELEGNIKLSIINYDKIRLNRTKTIAEDMLNKKLYRELF
jgi:succinylglutamate desuccinylase